MSKPKSRIELPPEAEPARDFIEFLVARYEKRIDELEKQVKTLTGQIQKLTPRNSSLPPGTEHPHARPKRKRPTGKKRRQGGQKGHKRHQRELVPSEQCATVTTCHPRSCRRCGGGLQPDATAPKRHQVWDLPPIEPIVDEYQLFRGHCPCCGITTRADLPPGVPTGQCGPRLAAFTGLLMGHFRQSKRRASMFLGDLLNIPCSPAWTVKIQNLVSDAISAPYEQLRDELEKQPQLFVDESPTKEKKMKAWLWVAVARTFAVFGIFGNRSRESLVSLVGDDSGIILNCDRARMYLDGKRLQWCWAHLKRDIQKLIGFCDEILAHKEHLWTFLEAEGIEPTNNTAGRALRPAVIYRKLSFGTQSAKGSRYLERILTVSESCRLQNRNACEYLIEAMRAKFSGRLAPSLLPNAPQSTLFAS